MNKLHIQGVSKFMYGTKFILYCSMTCLMLIKFMHRTVYLKTAVKKTQTILWEFICNINSVFFHNINNFLIEVHFFSWTINTYFFHVCI